MEWIKSSERKPKPNYRTHVKEFGGRNNVSTYRTGNLQSERYWNETVEYWLDEAIQVQAKVSDDFGELNTASQTFSLDSMINQILWDAQIDDDYLDEARESIKILIEKASQNSR